MSPIPSGVDLTPSFVSLTGVPHTARGEPIFPISSEIYAEPLETLERGGEVAYHDSIEELLQANANPNLVGLPLAPEEEAALRNIKARPSRKREVVVDLLEQRSRSFYDVEDIARQVVHHTPAWGARVIPAFYKWFERRWPWDWTYDSLNSFFADDAAGRFLDEVYYVYSARRELPKYEYIKETLFSLQPDRREEYAHMVENSMNQLHEEDREWARDRVSNVIPYLPERQRRDVNNYIQKSTSRGDDFVDAINKWLQSAEVFTNATATNRAHQMMYALQILRARPVRENAHIGRGKPTFAEYLTKVNYNPTTYLQAIRKKAKAHGYAPSSIHFAEDGVHKLAIKTPAGQIVRFGRVGYGDFLIWSLFEKRGEVESGTAFNKRRTFHASHSKIKGNWKSNDFSPNNLALRLLW